MLVRSVPVTLFSLLISSVAAAHAGHAELAKMLDDYEAVRAALAADSAPGAVAAAKKLSASAHHAHVAAADKVKPELAAVHKAAEAMAKTAAELEKLRFAFGNVSKHTLAYLSKDLGMAKGLHFFECSMVNGYGKWVQKTDQAANPYMGSAMLNCGQHQEI